MAGAAAPENAERKAWRDGARKSTVERSYHARGQKNAEISKRNIPPPDLRTRSS